VFIFFVNFIVVGDKSLPSPFAQNMPLEQPNERVHFSTNVNVNAFDKIKNFREHERVNFIRQ